MISEFFANLAVWFVEWLASVFGEWTPPAAFTEAKTTMAELLAGFASLGVWVNWAVLGVCMLTAIAAWAVVLGIKLVRAIVAHIPVIGGAGD
ncbi:hypothetical protein [Leucobacter sp.]